jgi:thiol:disulfide interchange protein
MRLVLCSLLLVACASSGHDWAGSKHDWIEDEVRAAAVQNRLLVVEFHARWCEPCKQFERTVLPDPRVREALGNVRFVSYDGDSSVGKDAMARCEVNSFPTFVVIDGRGTVRMKKVGAAGGVEEFLRFLELAHTQVSGSAPSH